MVAFQTTVGNGFYGLILVEHLSDEDTLSVFKLACTFSNRDDIASLITHIPRTLRRKACTSPLESAISSVKTGITEVLILNSANVNQKFKEDALESNDTPAFTGWRCGA